MDDLRRELIALLAAALYLAAVRLVQRYRHLIDKWLPPTEPTPEPKPTDPEQATPEHTEIADAEQWLDQLKEPPEPDPPATR